MPARPVVLASMTAPEGHLCIDLFRRPDGSFGFELYRRDPEDPNGWGAPAGHGATRYVCDGDALCAARAVAPWLAP